MKAHHSQTQKHRHNSFTEQFHFTEKISYFLEQNAKACWQILFKNIVIIQIKIIEIKKKHIHRKKSHKKCSGGFVIIFSKFIHVL